MGNIDSLQYLYKKEINRNKRRSKTMDRMIKKRKAHRKEMIKLLKSRLVTVTSRGTVVIPMSIRELLKVKHGDTLVCIATGKSIRFRPLTKREEEMLNEK